MNGPNQGNSAPLTVSSPDLPAGTFPREFTCDGANRLPRLEWGTPPPGTKKLAIEMFDPDAPGGTFTHWLVYGIPPGISSLAAAPADAGEGVNDFGRPGYGGPCPPRGAAHHYHFAVLALDTGLGLAAGALRSDLESRLSGHLLGRGELVSATSAPDRVLASASQRPGPIHRTADLRASTRASCVDISRAESALFALCCPSAAGCS